MQEGSNPENPCYSSSGDLASLGYCPRTHLDHRRVLIIRIVRCRILRPRDDLLHSGRQLRLREDPVSSPGLPVLGPDSNTDLWLLYRLLLHFLLLTTLTLAGRAHPAFLILTVCLCTFLLQTLDVLRGLLRFRFSLAIALDLVAVDELVEEGHDEGFKECDRVSPGCQSHSLGRGLSTLR